MIEPLVDLTGTAINYHSRKSNLSCCLHINCRRICLHLTLSVKGAKSKFGKFMEKDIQR